MDPEALIDRLLKSECLDQEIRALSDHALCVVLDATETGPHSQTWSGRLIHGIAILAAAHKFRLDHNTPDFP
jgi:hypothetical protein